MKRQNRDKDRTEHHIYRWLLLGGLLLFLVSILFSYERRKGQIEQTVSDTLGLVKSTCQKYDDYAMGITTRDLQNLINKVNVVREYEQMENEDPDIWLEKFADEQYLSGIVLLDSNMEVQYQSGVVDEEFQKLMDLILEDQQIRQIRDYRTKVFADRVVIGEQTYEYAIGARAENAGTIICYADATVAQDDKYVITLNNMLDLDYQDQNQKLVVTDEEKVLATNAPALTGLTIAECPITSVMEQDLAPDNTGLIKLKQNGHIWYGKQDIYKTYHLYVFYRFSMLYTGFFLQMSVTLGLYLLFCFVIFSLLQRSRKEKLRQMEKEYYLSSAIARIYDVNLLLYPEKNTWEVILQTAPMEKLLTGITEADKMLREFSSKLMQPSAGETFLQFTDVKTMRKRLKGKPFLGYTYEAVSGKWYQVLLVPQGNGSNAEKMAVMLLMRNVTDQRMKELDYQQKLRDTADQAAIANAAKTDFLRRMSHDIRTPINGIRGMTEMGLASLSDPVRIRDCFEKIRTSSDFLLELVNNVLDMSKIEAGEAISEQISFDMQELLSRAVTIIAYQAKESQVDLICDVLQGEHWHLLGSPLNIQRVFQNIMSNAVKYNHPGGRVRVSCQETAYDGENVTFTFVCEDTGMGMSQEFQKHAYDIFAQEHKTARTTYAGSGIGLSIVKKTVDLMGGKIDFTSQEGAGTTFIIELTLKEDKTVSQLEDRKKETVSIAGMHILVAEDNELNMEIATYLLTENGASVTGAVNGKEAVDQFTESVPGTFDMILMDIMMPVMNGLEATKAIRASGHADAQRIPIIAVSANAFSDDMAASRASGMNDHLSKPLDVEKLLETISKYRVAEKVCEKET